MIGCASVKLAWSCLCSHLEEPACPPQGCLHGCGRAGCSDSSVQQIQEQLLDCGVSRGALIRLTERYGFVIHRKTSLDEGVIPLATDDAILYFFLNLPSTTAAFDSKTCPVCLS